MECFGGYSGSGHRVHGFVCVCVCEFFFVLARGQTQHPYMHRAHIDLLMDASSS